MAVQESVSCLTVHGVEGKSYIPKGLLTGSTGTRNLRS